MPAKFLRRLVANYEGLRPTNCPPNTENTEVPNPFWNRTDRPKTTLLDAVAWRPVLSFAGRHCHTLLSIAGHCRWHWTSAMQTWHGRTYGRASHGMAYGIASHGMAWHGMWRVACGMWHLVTCHVIQCRYCHAIPSIAVHCHPLPSALPSIAVHCRPL